MKTPFFAGDEVDPLNSIDLRPQLVRGLALFVELGRRQPHKPDWNDAPPLIVRVVVGKPDLQLAAADRPIVVKWRYDRYEKDRAVDRIAQLGLPESCASAPRFSIRPSSSCNGDTARCFDVAHLLHRNIGTGSVIRPGDVAFTATNCMTTRALHDAQRLSSAAAEGLSATAKVWASLHIARPSKFCTGIAARSTSSRQRILMAAMRLPVGSTPSPYG